MSRSFIIGIISTVVVALGLFVFFYYSYIKTPSRPLHEAIPNHAGLFVESSDWNSTMEILKKSHVIEGVLQNGHINTLYSKLMHWTGTINQQDALKYILNDSKFAISFHNLNDKFSILMVFQVSDIENLEANVGNLAKQLQLKSKQRLFEKEKVYDLIDETGSLVLSCVYVDGFVLLSENGVLIEDAIRKLKYKLTSNWQTIDKLYTLASSSATLQVYINYSYIDALLLCFGKYTSANFIKHLAAWSMLDVKVENKQWLLSGVTNTDDTLYQFLDVFTAQKPVEWQSLLNYLPDNTSYFIQTGFDNYFSYQSDLNEFLRSYAIHDTIANVKSQIKQKTGIVLDEYVDLFTGSSVVFQTQTDLLQAPINAITTLGNTKSAEMLFMQLHNRLNATDSSSFGQHATTKIYYLPCGQILLPLLGPVFDRINNPYVAIVNNVAIWSNSIKELKVILDKVGTKNTLKSSQDFKPSQSLNSTVSNFSFYFNTGRFISHVMPSLNPFGTSLVNRYASDIKKFNSFQMQFASTDEKLFYTQLRFIYDPNYKEESRQLWSFKPDTSLAGYPQFLELMDGSLAVFMQDSLRNLYMLNTAGELVWKKQLNAFINGSIHQALVAPDWKQGLYFISHDNILHGLYMDGKDIATFPIKLPGVARGDLLITDWYQDSTFQLTVMLTNNKLLGYTPNGRLISGWNPLNLTQTIASKTQSVNIPGKGIHIYVIDEDNVTHFYNKAGKTHTYSQIPFSDIQPLWITDERNLYYWYTDSSYTLKVLSVDTLMLNNQAVGPVLHSIPIQTITSIHKQQDRVWLKTANQLSVYQVSGLLVKQFNEQDSVVHFFSKSLYAKGSVFGYVKYATNTAIMYQYDGKLYDGFPMPDATYFAIAPEIGRNRNLACVVNDSGNIILYYIR